jgi:hypothetical protein
MIGIFRIWTFSCYLAGGFLDRCCAFLNYKTPLQRLAAMRGLVQGLKKSLSRELLDESNIVGALQLASQSNHINPLLFGGSLGAWLLVRFNKMNEVDSVYEDRALSKWTYYDHVEKRVKFALLILAIVMTKNVENAI